MAAFQSQADVWHEAQSTLLPQEPYLTGFGQIQGPGLRNIVDICRQLAARDSRRPDKAVLFARDVLKALFHDRAIDLCSILPSTAYDNPYVAVQELVDASSHFFNTFFEGNEKLADELWSSIYGQIQSCHLGTRLTEESVLMYCLSGYIIRLLPTESQSDRPLLQRNTVRQRIHTPLDLFLPTSPVLNRIRFETDGSEPDRTAVHPRHLKMFCNLLATFCSVEEFPSPSRLMVLRHLVKQFHVFCTFETVDSDMAATKSAVLANPPFSAALYNFLYTFLEQCPSSATLQDLIGIWLSFCRPWRYSPVDIVDVTGSAFEPFIRGQEKFYRILLGKIMRKLAELEITTETTRTMKGILECTWREPMYTVVRKLLSLDCRPAARKVLDRLAAVYRTEKAKIQTIEQEKADEPWWKGMFSMMEDQPQLVASKNLVEAIEPILKDADTFMHTDYLEKGATRAVFSPLAKTSISTLDETPKRGYLPDHETDAATGLMFATSLGRKQIFEKERSFDFSQCHSYVPQWQSAPREYEFAPMVYAMRYLAGYLNRFPAIQQLGARYYDNGLVGHLVRVLMDPPCPNPHAKVQSPFFARELRKTPPTLRVRVLANNAFLLALMFVVLFLLIGWWSLLPLCIFLFAILIIYANESSLSM